MAQSKQMLPFWGSWRETPERAAVRRSVGFNPLHRFAVPLPQRGRI